MSSTFPNDPSAELSIVFLVAEIGMWRVLTRKPRVQGVLWLSAHLQHNEEKIFGVPSNLLCHLGSVDFELYRFRRRWNFVSDLDVETWTNIVLHE